jgi:hypothetical protein
MANAKIGMPSLTKLFQTPVTTTKSVLRDREKPHDDSIVYVRPTATAPPAGTAFETAVVDCVSTAACGSRRPGVATTTTTQ